MAKLTQEQVLTVHEAASMAGVPPKHVHRTVRAGLLEGFVGVRKGARVISGGALVALKLTHETAGSLAPEGTRKLTRFVLENPKANVARDGAITVDLRPMKREVKRRIASVERARKMVIADKGVMGGAPCYKGTRIPVHLVAEMMANGDPLEDMLEHYPRLNEEQLLAAPLYAEAFPERVRPRRGPRWPGYTLVRSVKYPYERVSRLAEVSD